MATILVTQATGQQSSYVIKNLLAKGAKIHALVRDLDKVPSHLRNPNITLFQGESKNPDKVYAAAQGCSGVFLNTWMVPGLELQQGQGVVEGAKRAGINTLVLSTAFAVDNRTYWDNDATRSINLWNYFNSKYEVEQVVRNAGFRHYTILRPGFIHYDFLSPGVKGNYGRLTTHGELDHLYEPESRMAYTDADDIGRLAAEALLDGKYAGAEIEMGMDLRSMDEVQAIVSRLRGQEVPAFKRTRAEMEELGAINFALPFHEMVNLGGLADHVEGKKKQHAELGIKLSTLEGALTRERARLIETIPEKTV